MLPGGRSAGLVPLHFQRAAIYSALASIGYRNCPTLQAHLHRFLGSWTISLVVSQVFYFSCSSLCSMSTQLWCRMTAFCNARPLVLQALLSAGESRWRFGGGYRYLQFTDSVVFFRHKPDPKNRLAVLFCESGMCVFIDRKCVSASAILESIPFLGPVAEDLSKVQRRSATQLGTWTSQDHANLHDDDDDDMREEDKHIFLLKQSVSRRDWKQVAQIVDNMR